MLTAYRANVSRRPIVSTRNADKRTLFKSASRRVQGALQKPYPRSPVPAVPSPHPAHPGAGASWASAGGSCASAYRWYHQLGWQGAEPSSRCDGSGSKRAHGGCSGARLRASGGRIAMEWPHKPFTSSRCWAAVERRGRIPRVSRPAAPLPGVLTHFTLRVSDATPAL